MGILAIDFNPRLRDFPAQAAANKVAFRIYTTEMAYPFGYFELQATTD